MAISTCVTCSSTHVDVDHAHGMCSTCWDALSGQTPFCTRCGYESEALVCEFCAQADAHYDSQIIADEYDQAFAHLTHPREDEAWLQQYICASCGVHEGELADGEVIDRRCPACLNALPHAIPLSDSPVAPASWPVWVVLGLAVTLIITVSTLLIVSPL